MTDKTQPEALRLALSIDLMDTFTDYQQEELNKAAAELRRQHARIAELEAELEAVGAGGVQALSAAPAVAAPAAPTPEHIAAMERAWLWMDNQADQQSKGGHATFDLMMLREERDALRAAIDAAPKAAPGEPDWWRKHADEIEVQVALTGSPEAMRCYTDMRTLLQAAAGAAPQQEAQEPMAIKAMGYGGSTGINDYLMSDGTIKAMRPSEVVWAAPQPAPAPLSDDVVKDAARWRWLSEHIGAAWNEGKFTSLVRIVSDKNRAALNASIDRMMTGDWSDAALAAQGGAA